MSDTPIFDMLRFREGFNPLVDVEYEEVAVWGTGQIVKSIATFGGSNEWYTDL